MLGIFSNFWKILKILKKKKRKPWNDVGTRSWMVCHLRPGAKERPSVLRCVISVWLKLPIFIFIYIYLSINLFILCLEAASCLADGMKAFLDLAGSVATFRNTGL